MLPKIGCVLRTVLLASLVCAAAVEVRGQLPQFAETYTASGEPGAAFAPPQPHPPQTAQPLVAMHGLLFKTAGGGLYPTFPARLNANSLWPSFVAGRRMVVGMVRPPRL